MEEIQEEFINTPKIMEFLKKVVKTISLKILINLAVLIFRNVRTALIQKVKSQETKVIVGPLQNIQSGK